MPFRSGHYTATSEAEDWEIIAADWWRTSFRSVPWSYIPKQDPVNKKWHRNRSYGSLFYNPYWKRNHVKEEEEDALNVDLVGVRAALESVVIYEQDVGFNLKLNLSEGIDLSLAVEEKELSVGKKRWEELVEELMGGHASDSDESLESSFIGGDLHRSTSTLSSVDMTFSEGSVESNGMPSTPKPKSSFNDVEIKQPSPDYHLQPMSPTRALNASASSFVPTFSSQSIDEPLRFSSPKPISPPASFANFTFPTLNAQTPAIKIMKDDQGFFTEVQVDNPSVSSLGSELLPPFLQEPSQRSRTRKSRTREIVDRLRSQLTPTMESDTAHLQQTSSTSSPKPTSHNSVDGSTVVTPRLSVSEDGDRVSRLSTPSYEDDGWIDISQPHVTSPSHKSRRARELLLALTRRRTDSLTSENIKEMMTESNMSSSGLQETPLSSSPSPSPPLITPNDDWTESTTVPIPEPQKKKNKQSSPPIPKDPHHHTQSHNRKKSSTHASRASTSSTASHLHSHPHLHPHHQQHPHPHPQQFSAASSSCYPHPQHPSTGAFPQMVAPQTVPYFFPAYPTVAMPVSYPAFVQPHFPVGMPVHGHTALVNPVMTAAGVQYAPMPPPLMPAAPRAGTSMKHSSTSTANMSMPPAFRTKNAAVPLW